MKLLGLKSKNLLLKFNFASAPLTTSAARPLAAISGGDHKDGVAGDKHHDEDDPHRFFDKDIEYIRKYAPIERKYKPPPFMGHTGFGQPDCEVFVEKLTHDYPDGPEKYYEIAYYREGWTGPFNKKDYYLNKYFFSAVFWGVWLWYGFYFGYETLLLEPSLTLPIPENFTDAELGIPADGSLPQRIYAHDFEL